MWLMSNSGNGSSKHTSNFELLHLEENWITYSNSAKYMLSNTKNKKYINQIHKLIYCSLLLKIFQL